MRHYRIFKCSLVAFLFPQTAIDLLHRREAQLAMRDYDNVHRDEPGEESRLEAGELKR